MNPNCDHQDWLDHIESERQRAAEKVYPHQLEDENERYSGA